MMQMTTKMYSPDDTGGGNTVGMDEGGQGTGMSSGMGSGGSMMDSGDIGGGTSSLSDDDISDSGMGTFSGDSPMENTQTSSLDESTGSGAAEMNDTDD